MDTHSVWRGTAASTGFAALAGDASTDVLVIGGGITGVTAAVLLAEQGREVMLLEAGEIGGGTTGHSTGNLYETVGDGMHAILSHWGDEVARQVMAERRAAIAFVAARCSRLPDVGFRRCPLVLWAQDAGQQKDIDQEIDALDAVGARVERSTAAPATLPAATGDVLVLPDQAQFQPQAYVVAMAGAAAARGARVHEHTHVGELDLRARRAVTPRGTVTAREIVLATHSPLGVHLVHAGMPVHREYAIALEMEAGQPGPGAGIFWWHGAEGLSLRTAQAGERHFLVCAGTEHKVGTHNAKAGLIALEQQARRLFGERPVAYRWSAQNYRGADGLPAIGRDQAGCFIATGYSTDGLTWGTVAARLVAAELLGHPAAFAHTVRPDRLSPVKSAKAVAQESVTVAKQLVKDYLTHRQVEQLSELRPGDSAIVEAEGESVAAWRAPDGELFAVSSVCPHMGCKVHWNSVETSWDCPCHGSRFRPDGTVMEGPALRPLQRRRAPALGDGSAPA